jgi:hypothetical protein
MLLWTPAGVYPLLDTGRAGVTRFLTFCEDSKLYHAKKLLILKPADVIFQNCLKYEVYTAEEK